MRLEGKTAVITGAAGDIGGATTHRFVEEGARLALLDRDEGGLTALGDALGAPAQAVRADVTDEDSIAAAARSVQSAYRTVDILFVNAGIEQSHTPLTDMTKEAFERVVAINLTGAFLTAKHFLPLVADNGSVIFTSSIAGLMPMPAYAAYSASKAGLIGLMRSASVDVAPRGIRCNTIQPGPVRSKMLTRSAEEATGGGNIEAFFTAMSGMARLNRLVKPVDVATLALFLASDESSMITGQSITVDGGIVQ
ncbi:SDR family oxidoreductase [Sphingobium sp. Sx8-8]|uniref:SDR family NAD(P)-dependent oxidoreductase n=1 Tax=Sphingobium sp. Sx8-8 TaxID=2933617 RepID=UPI001F5A1FA1|nr:SDR family oxidoreductase [Sphingobium sp. Sx8-8]